MCVCTCFQDAPRAPVLSLITSCVEQVTSQILSSGVCASSSSVSFVEFGQWYNSAGHWVVPWIELLDLKKWPDVLADGGEEDR